MDQDNEILTGVHVIDEAGYAKYRAEMTPVLEAHGGRFVLDVRVAEILRAPTATVFNRLFTIRFPSSRHRDAFFADPDYLAIRTRLFEPSVSAMVRLGDYAVVGSPDGKKSGAM
jgi:uncharacterized protein (DUF1330 family)